MLILTMPFAMLFGSSLSGCAVVPVSNSQFCADKGKVGATCDWTNGGPTVHLTKPEWDKKRFGMACTEVSTITKLLGVIKKLCFDSGRCSFEEYKELEKSVLKLYRKLDFDVDAAISQLEAAAPSQVYIQK